MLDAFDLQCGDVANEVVAELYERRIRQLLALQDPEDVVLVFMRNLREADVQDAFNVVRRWLAQVCKDQKQFSDIIGELCDAVYTQHNLSYRISREAAEKLILKLSSLHYHSNPASTKASQQTPLERAKQIVAA